MLDQLTSFASPEVERLLRKIELDENEYDKELRQANREKIVLPVTMSTRDGEVKVSAFSRNLSASGMCVITPQPFTEGAEFKLGLEYGEISHTSTGRCCWNDSFGGSYWVSGWDLDKDLNFSSIQSADGRADWESRAMPRKKVAVPVVVHQKNGKPKLNAFTRNMSGLGVCLVATEAIEVKSFCLLEIVRCDGERIELVAECIWAKPFGNYFMCGWEFPRLDRVQSFQRGFWN